MQTFLGVVSGVNASLAVKPTAIADSTKRVMQ